MQFARFGSILNRVIEGQKRFLSLSLSLSLLFSLFLALTLTGCGGSSGGGNDDDNKQKSPPSIVWQKSLGGSDYDYANSIQQTSDGGYIIAGESYSNDGNVTDHHGSTDNYDYWIVKLNANGAIEWDKSLGGSNSDWATSIQQTKDGGYIIAGYSRSTDGNVTDRDSAYNYDYWIVKLDADGAIVWKKSLGGSADDVATSIQQTKDGGYIIAGGSCSTDGNVTDHHGTVADGDYWIVKLDANGAIEWQESLGGSADDWATSIQQTKDGGYIIAGYSRSTDGNVTDHHGSTDNYDYWIVKLDADGAIEWDKSLGGSSYDYANSIQQTKDNGYIVAGYSYSTDGDITGHHGSTSYPDYWIVKLDANGAIEWDKSLGGSYNDEANSIQQTKDGGYIIAGYSLSNDGNVTENQGYGDYWIVKLDASGAIEWQKSLGGSSYDYAYSIQQTKDNGYIIAGESWSNDGDITENHGNADYWIVKLK